MARPSTRARCSLAQNRVMGPNSRRAELLYRDMMLVSSVCRRALGCECGGIHWAKPRMLSVSSRVFSLTLWSPKPSNLARETPCS